MPGLPNYNREFDLPPVGLRPSGISFHTEVPDHLAILDQSPPLLSTPPEDETFYPYDVADPAIVPPNYAPTMERVEEAMDGLYPAYRRALRLRYGLDTGEALTWHATSKALGVHGTTAERWVNAALRDIKSRPAETLPRSPAASPEPLEPPPQDPVPAHSAFPTPPESPAPKVLFAEDVKDVEFDSARYVTALRAAGLDERRIANMQILFFANKSLANHIVTDPHRMGRWLGRMGIFTRGAYWKDSTIAVKVDRHADATLAEITRLFLDKAIPSRTPQRPHGELSLKETISTLGFTLAISGAVGEAANRAALHSPVLTTILGLFGVGGALGWAGTKLHTDFQNSATDKRWRKEFGPFVTTTKK